MKRFLIISILGIVALAWTQVGYMSHTTVLTSAPQGSCGPNEVVFDSGDNQVFICPASGTWPVSPAMWNYKVPSGLVTFITSGTCPTGWTEVSSLNGVIFRGTIAANGDVGASGGHNTITPTGTISTPVFTGSQGTTSAISAGTPAGTNGTVTVATVTGSKAGTSAGAFSTIGGVSPGSSFTIPAETFTGSSMATHTHTITPTGTISTPTFTGVAIDPSPSYVKVIPCSAN